MTNAERMRWANALRKSNQPDSKARLTCDNVWSGRRDSNPRPSPWQGCDIGWFASSGSTEQGLPVGFSAESAESARFREPWFNALNEPGFAESPRAVPSRRPKQNRRTTVCDRPLVRPTLRAEHQARLHNGEAPPSSRCVEHSPFSTIGSAYRWSGVTPAGRGRRTRRPRRLWPSLHRLRLRTCRLVHRSIRR